MKINVWVVPRAKKERIEKIVGGFKVYIREPAFEGRANKKVIEVIAERYGVKKSAVTIVLGGKNRNKVVEICI